MARMSAIARKTNETDISLNLTLEGTGQFAGATGVGFMDHMLTLFAHHGRFDLTIACTGDTCVDDHHTVEDMGIALGQAFAEALGDRRGITRYGSFLLPMDEALVQIALDISGRACLCYGLELPTEKIGSFDTELVEEFLLGFTRSLQAGIHVRQLAGGNSHHIVEAMFKGLGRALAIACAIDPRTAGEIPSTKGSL